MNRRVSDTSVLDRSASDLIRPGPESIGDGAECLLVPFETFGGARNMSIDQSLLEAVDAGGPAVLRFYGWSEPTLSLGYFQSVRDRESHRDSGELTLVRRATGGGAIVHDRELTYSVAVRPADRSPGGREELYQGIHAAIAEAVQESGLRVRAYRESAGRLQDPDAFLCFQRRTAEDLIAHGYKILGSAQRRGRHAVLQHGSLLLRSSPHAPRVARSRGLGCRVDRGGSAIGSDHRAGHIAVRVAGASVAASRVAPRTRCGDRAGTFCRRRLDREAVDREGLGSVSKGRFRSARAALSRIFAEQKVTMTPFETEPSFWASWLYPAGLLRIGVAGWP